MRRGVPPLCVDIVYSYARQDQALLDRLENHLSILKHRGLITTWYTGCIPVGQDHSSELALHFSTAHIILFLVSAYFLASRQCYFYEMPQALLRQQLDEVYVVPILLRPVLLTHAPFAHLAVLPSNKRPVTSWRDRELAFLNIAVGIELLVEKILIPLPPPKTSQPEKYRDRRESRGGLYDRDLGGDRGYGEGGSVRIQTRSCCRAT